MIDALDVEGTRAPAGRKAQQGPKGAEGSKARKTRMTREQRIEALGRAHAEGYLDDDGPLKFVSADPFADFPAPTASRHELLRGLHQRLRPRTYWEVGVDDGQSLTLSRTKSIGVDPYFTIIRPIRCDVRLFRNTSDDYFRREDAFEHFAGVPVDLAFIDGMHLAEFALRDFMNIEKHMAPGGVVVIDDMLPRNSLEAYRIRRTRGWTGDVYKIHDVLATYRPDLTLIPVNTRPTGTMVVVGVDPASTVLDDNYPEIEAAISTPDPQVVPDAWLERRAAVTPGDLLDAGIWSDVVDLRDSGADLAAYAPLWKRLAELPPARRSDDDQ
jgi:hypothetical protein